MDNLSTGHSPLFFLILPRPLSPTLFPYTTLFRSEGARQRHAGHRPHVDDRSAPCPRALPGRRGSIVNRSEEHTSELQSHSDLVCRLLLEKKKTLHMMRRPH